MRVALVMSMLVNAALGISLYRYVDDYARLQEWSCAQGNGGYECGEE